MVVNVTDWAISCGSGRDSPRPYARRTLVSGVSPYRRERLGSTSKYEPLALTLSVFAVVSKLSVERLVCSKRTPASRRALVEKSTVFMT